MLTPTSRATAEDIVKADLERVDQAMWLALCEMRGHLDRWADYGAFCKWCEAVNARASEIFSRLN